MKTNWNNAGGSRALRVATLAACLTISGSAVAAGMMKPAPADQPNTQGMPVPNCTTWKASSQPERTAFIVGVANTFALELAYVTKTRRTDLMPGERASKILASTTIADVDARITTWCNANPDKANMPIIGVIWVDMVKPKI